MKMFKNSKRIFALICLSTVFANACAFAVENQKRDLSKDLSVSYDPKVEDNQFFSLISRIRYINRWALYRNIEKEDLADHSLEVGMIAHALALIKNKKFGGKLNAERAAVLGMYHDATEIVTGDMPTPVKYYDPQMKPLYTETENKASDEMLSMLPEEFTDDYEPLLKPKAEDAELWKTVKQADTISAVIKCLREKRLANGDFDKALASAVKKVRDFKAPEVDYFLEVFMPSFGLDKPLNQNAEKQA